jgi:hypothetical protein
MARQRQVYVIEFKAEKGRKWFESDCFTSIKEARDELVLWKKHNPDDNYRIVKYYPRDDVAI